MSAAPDPVLNADLLLAHEPFVRALARRLLDDEDRARDLAQDAWVAALTRPPTTGAALKGWLAAVVRNAARNALRSDARRDERERAAARPERVESTLAIQERLAVQRAVVDAVLRLPEPYRSPVLLRFYEGLAPDAIAARLGRKAPTVRSQLTRALELLRRDLDDLHDGDRGAWGTALAPLVRQASRSRLATTLVAAGLATVAAAPLVWLALRDPATPSVAALAPTGAPNAAASAAAPLAPTSAAAARLAADSEEDDEESTAMAVSSDGPPEDLDGLPLNDVLALAVQTRRRLTEAVLAPDPALASQHASFLAQPDTGLARLLGTACDSADLAVTGEGRFYSFEARSNDLSWGADLALMQDGRLYAAPHSVASFLVPLGDADLETLPEGPNALPPGLDEETREAWELAWSDIERDGHDVDPEVRAWVQEHGLRVRPLELGTYLVRVMPSDTVDRLIAFEVVDVEGGAATILWRTVKRWGTWKPKSRPTMWDERYWWVGPPPAWLAELDVAELSALLAELRAAGQRRLLEPSEELLAEHADLVADPHAGVARIVHRLRYDALLDGREGGAYFSFATQENGFDRRPELGLELDAFSADAGRLRGLVLDLGAVDLDDVSDDVSGPPLGLTTSELDVWTFLWNATCAPEDEAQELQEARALGLGRGTLARVGHTYLLRARHHEGDDRLVAFEVLEGDGSGYTFAWRILREQLPEDE